MVSPKREEAAWACGDSPRADGDAWRARSPYQDFHWCKSRKFDTCPPSCPQPPPLQAHLEATSVLAAGVIVSHLVFDIFHQHQEAVGIVVAGV